MQRIHTMQLYWSRGFSPAVSGKQFNTREKMGMRLIRTHLVMRIHVVIASVAWQSRRRSNGGSPTCVQLHRDCHVPRRTRDERALLAMTD